MASSERTVEDRLLILETRYEEHDKHLQAMLNDMRADLAKISNGGMAICATHGQSIMQLEAGLALLKAELTESRRESITQLEAAISLLKSELAETRREAVDSIHRVWAQLWAFVGIWAAAGISALIAHVTGAF